MIDLHTHTDQSDGSYTPQQLVDAAAAIGLEALAISDHDTLDGYDMAVEPARRCGLDLVCGIELSTKLRGRTVHLLGYFLKQPPSDGFREWLDQMKASRRDRNLRLAERLRSLGIDITLEEVQKRGRSLTGRPHFAKVLVEKGYVSSIQQAFDEYLDESAKGYVDRQEPQVREGIERIVEGGGVASIAHPVRIAVRGRREMADLVAQMKEEGLGALEVFHSDHDAEAVSEFLEMTRHFDLGVTGGSDFHGDVKPNVRLGVGSGSLNIPREVLDRLREL